MNRRDSSFPGKVLVTTDLSEASSAAFPYAAHYARSASSELNIVTVIEDPVFPIPFGEGLIAVPETEEMRKEYKARAEAKLKELGSKHLSQTPHKAIVQEYCGSPGDAIVRYAKEQGCGLIVIATQGHGLVGQIVLGSVSERVLRQAPCPVLIVPSKGKAGSAAANLPYKRILLTTDFSEAADAAFPIALSEAKSSGATINLVYIIERLFAPELLDIQGPWDRNTAAEVQTRYRKELDANLKKKAEVFSSAKCVHGVLEKDLSVANTIVHHAQKSEADLLIMSLRGASQHSNLLGSITERVARRLPCPLLVVPPR